MVHVVLFIGISVGIVWALIVFPALRVAFVIFLIVGGALVALAIKNNIEADKKREEKALVEEQASKLRKAEKEKRDAVRWSLVRPTEVELRSAELKQKLGVSRAFTGSIINNSQYRVTEVELDFIAYDCISVAPQPDLSARAPRKPVGEKCVVIGQAKYTFRASIPSGQARGIAGDITLSNFPKIEGRESWNVKPVRVRGSENANESQYEHLIEKYGSD